MITRRIKFQHNPILPPPAKIRLEYRPDDREIKTFRRPGNKDISLLVQDHFTPGIISIVADQRIGLLIVRPRLVLHIHTVVPRPSYPHTARERIAAGSDPGHEHV